MSTSYTLLTFIIISLIVFLYLSWVFVSNEIANKEKKQETEKRRDFLFTSSYALGAVAVGVAVWPLIDQMNPDASIKALAITEVDISNIGLGKTITVVWRGKPVFIRRRTQEEINEAQNVKLEELKDPQKDQDRVKKSEWLVMLGVCTHLGCIPLGNKGEFNGWFCPCHGSHYDTSGRIRKGPAPTTPPNLLGTALKIA